jgi:hypothetical protein
MSRKNEASTRPAGRAKECGKSSRHEGAPDRADSAIDIILRGRHRDKKGLKSTTTEMAEDAIRRMDADDIVVSFYRGIDRRDVQAALQRAKQSRQLDSRKEAVTVLAAYFNWCVHNGVEHTADGHAVGPLLSQFGAVIARLLSGYTDDDGNLNQVIPFAVAPDQALGWSHGSHRPIDRDHDLMRMVVYAFVEIQYRRAITLGKAKKAAASRYSLHIRQVQAYYKEAKDDGVIPYIFGCDSERELERFLNEFEPAILPGS